MKRQTFAQKKEALTNSLNYFGFAPKYFIQPADGRIGHKFAIATSTDNGGINIHTNYMSYEEMNAFLMGYNKAKTKPLV